MEKLYQQKQLDEITRQEKIREAVHLICYPITSLFSQRFRDSTLEPLEIEARTQIY